ncbi:MAG TPA: hypothetical protein VFS64_00180 [Solirubrobacterales bacterium]|nr:hypothetical protein [Solirubrobacterales bacterium]
MADRLRALLDRPLDPSAARAILVFSSAILVGLTALFVLAAGEPDRQASTAEKRSPIAAPPASAGRFEGQRPERRDPVRRQDPQDVEGSAAARRAARELRSHRALQHVPYRDGRARIVLAGARGSRAVLRISASTVRVARREWHRFLRRYRDSGRAYVPVFKAPARRGGTRGGA